MIFIKYYKKIDENFQVPLESLITLFVCKYVNVGKINLIQGEGNSSFMVKLLNCDYEILKENLLCELPCIKTGNIFISGLCAVVREIIKESKIVELLGFKQACLRAPNEVSIWTKFCEIDMIRAVNQLYENDVEKEIVIPVDLIRFENHMSQPVRIHNIYKLARNYETITDCSIPKEKLNIPHQYVEGPFLTIADLILIPQVVLLVKSISKKVLTEVPLVANWFNLMLQNKIQEILEDLIFMEDTQQDFLFTKPEVKIESLYKSDPKRYKPQNRIYTKQTDIIDSFELIKELDIKTPTKPYGHDVKFNWNDIPEEATPIGGNLPKSRSTKKFQQLENLVKATIRLAKPNYTIVDFCSGAGHLGILLAYLLPNCTIILLENKEESLFRAKKRIDNLNLKNVVLVQSNLDYYIGDFDIGISLHACGVATDLVIQKCLDKKAAMVCCPCCYGGIHNCHHLTYPRSSIFKNSINLKNYLVLGHSADQTHDAENSKTKQGEFCMNVIDSDRILHIEENGYVVEFGKLDPSSCTPKNNLIVGWHQSNCF